MLRKTGVRFGKAAFTLQHLYGCYGVVRLTQLGRETEAQDELMVAVEHHEVALKMLLA